MSDEISGSTRELLNVHHAAILRELDGLQRSVRGDLQNIRTDLTVARARLEAHGSRLSVLQWAYGIGVVIVMAILAKIGWTQ